MDSNLYHQFTSLVSSHSHLDEFRFYFLGICHRYAPQAPSLESLFTQLSTHFSDLSKDSIVKRVHETKIPSIGKKNFQNLQDILSVIVLLKKEDKLKNLFKDFEIFPLLFPKLSEFQWFYLGTFMATYPTFGLRNLLRKVYIDLLAHAYKNSDESVKVAFLASLLQEEEKSEMKEGYEEEKKVDHQNAPAPLEKQTCPICFDSISNRSKKTTLTQCRHAFHFKCFERYLQTVMAEKKFPLRCPMDGCLVELPEYDTMKNLSKTYRRKFHSFTLKSFVETHENEIFCCPSPNCDYFEFLAGSACKSFECRKCKKKYCLKCRKFLHDETVSCDQADQAVFAKLASRHGYRRCSSCHMYIEKHGGCNHMRCRCSHEFDWSWKTNL